MGKTEFLLGLAFLLVAILYSAVGHAGGTGYLTAMALTGMAPENMKPTALILNLVVGTIGLIQFGRSGHIKLSNVLPFALASLPTVWVASRLHFAAPGFTLILGILVMVGAIGIFAQAERAEALDSRAMTTHMPFFGALFTGGCIGLFSAMTGTGGAVLLTPLILLAGWMPSREAFGTSVVIVWLNSLLALWLLETPSYPPALPTWSAVVAVGAIIGTYLSLKKFSARALRWMLGAVMVIAAARMLLLN